VAALLESYHCHSVTGDRYAGEWPRETFRSHGIEYRVAELDRSRLYLELLPITNTGTVELPDEAKLLPELRGLERRRGAAGRDRVDHAPGQHDDRANAAAGVVVGLAMERTDETITALDVPIPYRKSIWRPSTQRDRTKTVLYYAAFPNTYECEASIQHRGAG